MKDELENLCNFVLPVLTDPSNDVVVLVLQLLATIASTPHDNPGKGGTTQMPFLFDNTECIQALKML